jgi:hypothetical protein
LYPLHPPSPALPAEGREPEELVLPFGLVLTGYP